MATEPITNTSRTQDGHVDRNVWNDYAMALEDVTDRLLRITQALRGSDVPYALVGGQAVALWVATRAPAAVRTTKGVDLMVRRDDLGRARAAARSVRMDYFETMGVGMFLDLRAPDPRHAVHLLWAGEYVRPGHALPAPGIDQRTTLPGDFDVVLVAELAVMKLVSYRDQDRLHLHDLIDVGLIGRELLERLPDQLVERLDGLLNEQGR